MSYNIICYYIYIYYSYLIFYNIINILKTLKLEIIFDDEYSIIIMLYLYMFY